MMDSMFISGMGWGIVVGIVIGVSGVVWLLSGADKDGK